MRHPAVFSAEGSPTILPSTTIHSKMPKRSEEDESEWAMRKDDILKLYVEQNKPLSEVIRAMAKQGFTGT